MGHYNNRPRTFCISGGIKCAAKYASSVYKFHLLGEVSGYAFWHDDHDTFSIPNLLMNSLHAWVLPVSRTEIALFAFADMDGDEGPSPCFNCDLHRHSDVELADICMYAQGSRKPYAFFVFNDGDGVGSRHILMCGPIDHNPAEESRRAV